MPIPLLPLQSESGGLSNNADSQLSPALLSSTSRSSVRLLGTPGETGGFGSGERGHLPRSHAAESRRFQLPFSSDFGTSSSLLGDVLQSTYLSAQDTAQDSVNSLNDRIADSREEDARRVALDEANSKLGKTLAHIKLTLKEIDVEGKEKRISEKGNLSSPELQKIPFDKDSTVDPSPVENVSYKLVDIQFDNSSSRLQVGKTDSPMLLRHNRLNVTPKKLYTHQASGACEHDSRQSRTGEQSIAGTLGTPNSTTFSSDLQEKAKSAKVQEPDENTSMAPESPDRVIFKSTSNWDSSTLSISRLKDPDLDACQHGKFDTIVDTASGNCTNDSPIGKQASAFDIPSGSESDSSIEDAREHLKQYMKRKSQEAIQQVARKLSSIQANEDVGVDLSPLKLSKYSKQHKEKLKSKAKAETKSKSKSQRSKTKSRVKRPTSGEEVSFSREEIDDLKDAYANAKSMKASRASNNSAQPSTQSSSIAKDQAAHASSMKRSGQRRQNSCLKSHSEKIRRYSIPIREPNGSSNEERHHVESANNLDHDVFSNDYEFDDASNSYRHVSHESRFPSQVNSGYFRTASAISRDIQILETSSSESDDSDFDSNTGEFPTAFSHSIRHENRQPDHDITVGGQSVNLGIRPGYSQKFARRARDIMSNTASRPALNLKSQDLAYSQYPSAASSPALTKMVIDRRISSVKDEIIAGVMQKVSGKMHELQYRLEDSENRQTAKSRRIQDSFVKMREGNLLLQEDLLTMVTSLP